MSRPKPVVFTAHSTAEQVAAALGPAHAKGRVALITGANNGLGLESARVLAKEGATVVLACRSLANAQKACEGITAQYADAQVRPLVLDLASLASVREAAATFLSWGLPLHILLLNAGIMAVPLSLTQDGFESQFGVDHLGHFLLTALLFDALKAAQPPARVVSLSSRLHEVTAPHNGIQFDDLVYAKTHYNPWGAYGHAKLANILHMVELQKRFDAAGASQVKCVSVHPGVIESTGLTRHGPPAGQMLSYWRKLPGLIFTVKTKTLQAGASCQVYCALSPDVVGGEYYSDCAPELTGRRHRLWNDPEQAKKLWDVSEKLVGLQQQ